jgi:hypothetical protein
MYDENKKPCGQWGHALLRTVSHRIFTADTTSQTTRYSYD